MMKGSTVLCYKVQLGGAQCKIYIYKQLIEIVTLRIIKKDSFTDTYNNHIMQDKEITYSSCN